MILHSNIEPATLRSLIRNGRIKFAGYWPGHIYGRLDCKSGKRMKRENRVFFRSEVEAQQLGFRPCGNCMRKAYQEWKEEQEEWESWS
jgi:hypothetical protein